MSGLLFVALAAILLHDAHAGIVPCNEINSNLTKSRTDLGLNSSSKQNSHCGWSTSGEQVLLYIRSAKLADGDTFLFSSSGDGSHNQTFNSATLKGILVAPKGDWNLQVNFGNSTEERFLDIACYRTFLDLELTVAQADGLTINKPAQGANVTFNLAISKTSPHHTLIQHNGNVGVANKSENAFTLSNGFIMADVLTLTVNAKADHEINLKASAVSTECSKGGKSADSKEYPFVLPIEGDLPYTCAQLLKIENPDGYFQVDFAGFKNVNDIEDSLIFFDKDAPLILNRRVANNYEGKILTFKGNELAIIYKSPSIVEPLRMPLSFKSISLSFGGYQGHGELKKPSNTIKEKFIRYTYNGLPYASLILGSPLPAKVSMRVYEDYPVGDPVVVFNEGDSLPPLISLGYHKTLVVEFRDSGDGSALTDLPNYKFTNDTDLCSKLSNQDFDSISINDMKQPQCTWIIATKDPVQDASIIFSVDYLDFKNPKDCFSVIKLGPNKEEEVTKLCGRYRYSSPGKFLLDKNYKHYIRLTKDDSTASLSFFSSYSYVEHRDITSIKVPMESQNITLTSIGYPAPYPIGFGRKDYIISSMPKSTLNFFLIVFKDVDIRPSDRVALTYEKNAVFVGNSNHTLIGDKLINETCGISLQTTQPTIQLDEIPDKYKGFEVNVLAFDYAVRIESGNTTTIPANSTNVALILTSRGADSKNFNKRIAYNVTIENSKLSAETESLYYDARTISNPAYLSKGVKDSTTTSDTLIVLYKFKENVKKSGNNFLPKLTLNYQWIDCDTKNGELVCDSMSRCIPKSLQCNRRYDCDDKSDEDFSICNGTKPSPPPATAGVGGLTIFMLSIFMFVAGVVLSMYGPDLYRYFETRFRSGDYTTFTSSE